MSNSSKNNYQDYWEKFWSALSNQSDSRALWDIPVELSIGKDYPLFEPYFDPALPVLDLGCGTGGQAHFLAQKYKRVIAVDVSLTAIETARNRAPGANITFAQFDLTDQNNAKQIHQQYGDLNVYLRGVLHQMPKEDLPLAIASIETLIGNNGVLYLIESDDLTTFLGSKYSFSTLPVSFKKVITSRFPQKGITEKELEKLFSEFTIHQKGTTTLPTNIDYQNQKLELPAVYAILQNTR